MTITVRSYFETFAERRRVAIFETQPNGDRTVAKPLVFERVERWQLIQDATIENGDEFLQAVLNHAWDLGMRPAGFNDTTRQVAALKDHLNDMRALVFKQKPDRLSTGQQEGA